MSYMGIFYEKEIKQIREIVREELEKMKEEENGK